MLILFCLSSNRWYFLITSSYLFLSSPIVIIYPYFVTKIVLSKLSMLYLIEVSLSPPELKRNFNYDLYYYSIFLTFYKQISNYTAQYFIKENYWPKSFCSNPISLSITASFILVLNFKDPFAAECIAIRYCSSCEWEINCTIIGEPLYPYLVSKKWSITSD